MKTLRNRHSRSKTMRQRGGTKVTLGQLRDMQKTLGTVKSASTPDRVAAEKAITEILGRVSNGPTAPVGKQVDIDDSHIKTVMGIASSPTGRPAPRGAVSMGFAGPSRTLKDCDEELSALKLSMGALEGSTLQTISDLKSAGLAAQARITELEAERDAKEAAIGRLNAAEAALRDSSAADIAGVRTALGSVNTALAGENADLSGQVDALTASLASETAVSVAQRDEIGKIEAAITALAGQARRDADAASSALSAKEAEYAADVAGRQAALEKALAEITAADARTASVSRDLDKVKGDKAAAEVGVKMVSALASTLRGQLEEAKRETVVVQRALASKSADAERDATTAAERLASKTADADRASAAATASVAQNADLSTQLAAARAAEVAASAQRDAAADAAAGAAAARDAATADAAARSRAAADAETRATAAAAARGVSDTERTAALAAADVARNEKAAAEAELARIRAEKDAEIARISAALEAARLAETAAADSLRALLESSPTINSITAVDPADGASKSIRAGVFIPPVGTEITITWTSSPNPSAQACVFIILDSDNNPLFSKTIFPAGAPGSGQPSFTFSDNSITGDNISATIRDIIW